MYVPGSLGTKKVTYLVDTGCSHNLLSKSVFDRMPAGTRHQLVPLQTAAAMADGSGLPIYGSITLQRESTEHEVRRGIPCQPHCG